MSEDFDGPRRGRPRRDALYLQLDSDIAELWDRFGGLPNPDEAKEIWEGIWIEEAHHSTAIEGNTLVLKQVEQLLHEGRAVGNKELSEYLEVRGYADAASWVYGQAIAPGDWGDGSVLTMTELRRVHQLAMGQVWDVAPHSHATEQESPGQFRQHDIAPFPDGMTPPTWVDVPPQVSQWVRDVCKLRPRIKDMPLRVAALHCRFEQIHPFIDGNGRTGRLLLNLILVRLGYPPAIIYKSQRTKYMTALRKADAGHPGLLGDLLTRAITNNLHRFVIPAIAGPVRMVPLAALATKEVNANALRTAAYSGRLEAVRGRDGKWRSSKQAVDKYVASRYQRRTRNKKV